MDVFDNQPDPTFKLGEVYTYPNPAKLVNPKIQIKCGIADKLEIRIYDLASDLVHSAEIEGNRYLIIGNKYAYQYEWDISDVASGIYIYFIRALKQGEKDIKITKQLAIIQ